MTKTDEGSGLRVLVADDDPAIRMLVQRVLVRQGYEVTTANDGADAIVQLDQNRFDLLVLDLMMPRVDGFAVLRYIQENDPDILACTIIASAVPESEVLKRFDVPVYRVHSKPFDMQRLISDINRCSNS